MGSSHRLRQHRLTSIPHRFATESAAMDLQPSPSQRLSLGRAQRHAANAVADSGADPGGHGLAHQVTNVVAIVLPLAAFVLALVMLWGRLVEWIDVAILAVAYLATCLGITVGFHRLLTHRSFETYPAVRYALAVLGTLAVEGSVIKWVADHRKHHDLADEDGDPHSPHGHGDGLTGTLRGLFHAHVGWWMFDHPTAQGAEKYAPDLLEDRGMRAIHTLFVPLVVLGLVIPFGLGWLITGGLAGGLTALFWAGLVRIFMVHHITFSINSICHFFGRRRFATDDQSTNVFWLALPSFGESWHHNHHAFPRSALHGLRWWEVDLGGWVIRAMRRAGLAWNVVLITKERQQQKLAAKAQAVERAATQAATGPQGRVEAGV
jgi:stearoyl-CoA desaturase (Delta-9 desaturase)